MATEAAWTGNKQQISTAFSALGRMDIMFELLYNRYGAVHLVDANNQYTQYLSILNTFVRIASEILSSFCSLLKWQAKPSMLK